MTDERDPPSGTEHTIAAPDTNPASAATVAASSANVATTETVAENTLAPASDVVRRAAGTSPSSKPGSGLRSKSDSQARSVGEEMQAATIQRFGRVDRGRFELLDELARGGLGRVFRARDPRTNRIVAIKEVLQPSPDIITRFAREALVTANLQHPAIVPVYEVGRWESGEPFYAMKLVQGRTLDALIGESKTLDARMGLVPHLIVVADALAYAHSEHVIHRDLKPANILVGAYGETVVIDWGLAKNMVTGEEIDALPHATTIPPDNDGETMIGAVLGTPAYMPPEQAIGEKVDEHADVYAIGAILYHVLAGVRPYRLARTMDELLYQVANEAPQPVRELAPDAPPELIAIVEKAMARRPEDRYATAEGLAHDLRAFQAGKLVAAHRYTTRQLISRWIGRHRGMVLTAVVALGVLITIAAIGVWRITKERDVAKAEREEAREQRAEAQLQRGLAEERLSSSLEELGRQAIVARTPDKALPLLERAATLRDKTTATLDILIKVARDAYTGLAGIAPPHLRGTTFAGLARNGTWVVSSGADGTLRAWDLPNNREVWHAASGRLAALSPDGESLLAVDATGKLSIVAVADGKTLHEWHLDKGASTDVASVLAWAPDNAHFIAATPAGRVFMGAPTSSTLASVDPHTAVVWTAAFSTDGKLAATGGDDGVTMIRDATTGKTVAQLSEGPGSEVAAIVWLDGDRLISGDQKGVARLWSVSERRVVRRFQQPTAIYGITIGGTGDKQWLSTFGDTVVVTVWDIATGVARAKLAAHTLAVDIAVTVNDLLLTADETGNQFVWDPLTGDLVQTLPNEGSVQGLTALGDRAVIYGTNRQRVWKIAADRGVRRLPIHTARVRDLAWSADGRVLWSASHDGTARGVELATGKVTVLGTGGFSEPAMLAFPPPGTPPPPINPKGLRSLRLSPDGKMLATAAEDGSLILWDLADPARRNIPLVGHEGRVRRIAFSQDQRSAYSVGDHTLRAWDLTTGKQRAYVDLRGSGWDVALLGGDKVVVTQDETKPLNKVLMWSADDLRPLPVGGLATQLYELSGGGDHLMLGAETEIDVLPPSGKITTRVAFPNATAAAITGNKAMVAGAAGFVGLYSWPDLKEIRSWQSGTFVTAIKFRPDGAIVATAGDRRARLWDPLTGRLLVELDFPALLTQLAWSPDGTQLAVAGASGTVWVWDLAPTDHTTLGAYIKCAVPWQLEESSIVAATFDPAACAVLAH